MFFSAALLVVKSLNRGRVWNRKGYVPKPTPTQLRNRVKNRLLFLKNISVLKLAAANEPEVPTRLWKPLCHFRVVMMRRKLDEARRVLNWQGTLLPRVAQIVTQMKQDLNKSTLGDAGDRGSW